MKKRKLRKTLRKVKRGKTEEGKNKLKEERNIKYGIIGRKGETRERGRTKNMTNQNRGRSMEIYKQIQKEERRSR